MGLDRRSRPKWTIDSGYPTETHGLSPSFNTIEEVAFRDTHVATGHPNASHPAGLAVKPELARGSRADVSAPTVTQCADAPSGPASASWLWPVYGRKNDCSRKKGLGRRRVSGQLRSERRVMPELAHVVHEPKAEQRLAVLPMPNLVTVHTGTSMNHMNHRTGFP